jgi:bisphosphoglycerate-dependent phosphoglycerate mutase
MVCINPAQDLFSHAHSHHVLYQSLTSSSFSSEWNALNQYTGWCDVNLTRRGEGEARAAGRLLAENGIEIDHAFTSVLKRASYTTNMCLNMAGQQLSLL